MAAAPIRLLGRVTQRTFNELTIFPVWEDTHSWLLTQIKATGLVGTVIDFVTVKALSLNCWSTVAPLLFEQGKYKYPAESVLSA